MNYLMKGDNIRYSEFIEDDIRTVRVEIKDDDRPVVVIVYESELSHLGERMISKAVYIS